MAITRLFKRLIKPYKKGVCVGELRMGVNIAQCKECKADSIAHKTASFFDKTTINNKILFKWDNKNKKLLVSKTALMYLLSLQSDVEILQDYDMEIVEKIDFRKKEV